ncbi:uncharacterized protein LOC142335986 [Convolutriloba macropyga]|uniref:uncharacterized protein LOC142335986 n=1 Tax=Convolutriloba macropyga TaxID=536237 RepID=UPI003F51E3B8
MTSLSTDLDGLLIKLPTYQEKVKFSDDAQLLGFFKGQYPYWRIAGAVLSIPPLETPRIRLQRKEELEKIKNDKGNLKGKMGEWKIHDYRSEIGKSSSGRLLLFPNLNGKALRAQEAQVEIDLLVVHPNKGIFVFSVKNAKTFSNKNMLEQIQRHMRFVQIIRDYGYDRSQQIPIHGVLCSIEKEVNLPQDNPFYSIPGNGHRTVMDRDKLETYEKFQQAWNNFLSEIEDVEMSESFEIFISRIHVLSLMEVTKYKDDQPVCITNTCLNQESSCMFENLTVMIWTRAQMNVIAQFLDKLFSPRKLVQFFVHGSKGSGKTTLLMHLAKMVRVVSENSSLFKSEDGIVVCDAISTNCKYLERVISEFGIQVQPKLSAVDKFDFIFVDNYTSTKSNLLPKTRVDQNCIIFSTDSSIYKSSALMLASYTIFDLDADTLSLTKMSNVSLTKLNNVLDSIELNDQPNSTNPRETSYVHFSSILSVCVEKKQLGNLIFASKNISTALSVYSESFNTLKVVYSSELSNLKVSDLALARDELAKLCSNISICYLKLADDKNWADAMKQHLVYRSLEFASASCHWNPYWDKAIYRKIECYTVIEPSSGKIAGCELEREQLRHLSDESKARKLEDLVIQDKISSSYSYHLLIFRDNVLVVDKNDPCCFGTIKEAIDSKRFTTRAFGFD